MPGTSLPVVRDGVLLYFVVSVFDSHTAVRLLPDAVPSERALQQLQVRAETKKKVD